MLQYYLDKYRNASFLIPIGGIRAYERLLKLSNGKLYVLAGDKAHQFSDEFGVVLDPHIAIHGSFSFMANFHAVELYTAGQGGFALHTPFVEGFKCSSFITVSGLLMYI